MIRSFPGEARVKNLLANVWDLRDTDSFLGLERSLGVGNGNLLQYSCLENSMDKGALQAAVRGVTKIQIQLSDWTHTRTPT